MKSSPKQYLSFYREHEISPVSQDISDLERHFFRRGTLYRLLGIPGNLLEGSQILEFGPGGGHNATFLASCRPAKLVLVDGNPTALSQVGEIVPPHLKAGTEFKVIESYIEDFKSTSEFDLVLCEGVIPSQQNPAQFLEIVASHVGARGLLVMTCFDPVSVFSETLRRVASFLLVKRESSLDEKLSVLSPYFKKDLSTLAGMNRPVDDWVLDNIINPSLGDPLSMAEAIEALDKEFDVYGSSPQFFGDTRWYKSIDPIAPRFNQRAIDSYWSMLHNLLDYRLDLPPRDIEANKRLYSACGAVYSSTMKLEKTNDAGVLSVIQRELEKVIELVEPMSDITHKSLKSYQKALQNYFDSGYFGELDESFRPLFGRGQQYLSFTRK